MYFKSKCCKSQVLIAFVSIFLCVSTHASDIDSEEMHNLVSGNSIKIINRFAESIIYFESDGSFKSYAKQGSMSAGKWRVTKDSMCAVTAHSDTPSTPDNVLFLDVFNDRQHARRNFPLTFVFG